MSTRYIMRPRYSYEGYADVFSELHLLPSAPQEVVDAAYRALSLKYHPDKEGNKEAQQRLNDAYARISKILAARKVKVKTHG